MKKRRAPARSRLGDVGTAIGLAAAVPAFAATFRGPRDRFWSRMTATGLGLGALAITTFAAWRKQMFTMERLHPSLSL